MRTGRVGLRGDRASERRLLDVVDAEEDVLARRDVRADADGQPGERLGVLGRRHAAESRPEA
jgi:hypothetical protein